jgi:hypothetical protein
MDPHKLGQILRAAEGGDEIAYFELAEEIEEKDLHILSILGTRKRAICALPIEVDAAGDSPEEQADAELARDWLDTGVLQLSLFDILDAIGKLSSQVCFIMPERHARLDPNTPIPEAIGSGPFKFVESEYRPGSRVVYERNPDYVPRSEPASGIAGGKRVMLDRVIWDIMPDAQTAASALMAGEVDFYETPPVDILPTLSAAPGVKIEVFSKLGNVGQVRLNHLHPPFNNLAARKAAQQVREYARETAEELRKSFGFELPEDLAGQQARRPRERARRRRRAGLRPRSGRPWRRGGGSGGGPCGRGGGRAAGSVYSRGPT